MNTAPGRASLFARFARQALLFLLALSFLSRLAPGRAATAADMSGSVLYYPLAGAVLGLVLVLPFLLFSFSGQPWVCAWLYALLSAWLTRALHLDGLADVLDALGSGKSGDAFQAVLKDSRLGAFGATGLCFALAGHIILAAACFDSRQLAPLAFAPLYGRCLPILLACLAPVNPRAGLGALLSSAPKNRALAFAAVAALSCGIVSLGTAPLLLSLLFTCPPLFLLIRIARRENGFNGDFLGCVIIAGELAVLLACAL